MGVQANYKSLVGSAWSSPNLRDEWLSFIDQNIFKYTVPVGTPPDQRLELKAHSRTADGFTVARLSTICSRTQIRRDHAQIGSDGQDRYVLYSSLRGGLEFHQLGREQQVSPNSMALLSSAEPILHNKLGNNDTLCFLMPRDFVDARLVEGHDHCLRSLKINEGIGLVARNALATLDEQMMNMSDIEFQCGISIVADLFAVVLSGCNDLMTHDRSVKAANLARVKRYIQQNLSDSELSVSSIAENCGLSVSYLNKMFKSEEHTVYNFLKSERLKLARQLLSKPSSAPHPTITEIAVGCGFTNMAHFSTSFKKTFGVSPRDALNYGWSKKH